MRWLARLFEGIAERVIGAIEAALLEGCDCDEDTEEWEPVGSDELTQYHEAWTEAVDNEVISRVKEREFHFIWWEREIKAGRS